MLVCMCMHLQLSSQLYLFLWSEACIPSHANLLNNVSNPSKRQLFPITAQCHNKTSFSLQNCYLSTPPQPHSTTIVSLCSVCCSSWMKNGLKGGWGVAQGCQQRHNRCTHTHTHLQTHCALFLALLYYFSRLLSFCLFYLFFYTCFSTVWHTSVLNKGEWEKDLEAGETEWLRLQFFTVFKTYSCEAGYQECFFPWVQLTLPGQPCGHSKLSPCPKLDS